MKKLLILSIFALGAAMQADARVSAGASTGSGGTFQKTQGAAGGLNASVGQPSKVNRHASGAPVEHEPSRSSAPMGIKAESNSCGTDGGYKWCSALNQCVRPWETNCPAGPQ